MRITCPRGLKAVMNTLLGGNKRASRPPPVQWQQHHRALSDVAQKVPPRVVEAEGVVGEQIDLLLKRVDERWSFVQDPEHARGVLQTLRRCNTLARLLPRGTNNTTLKVAEKTPPLLLCASGW
jgi:hypothetical protein